MPQLLPTHDLAMQQLSYWSEIKQRDEQCRHLILCLVFKMTKLICMQALVHSANRYRYEPINWNRLSIPDAVLAYSPTSFGLCQRAPWNWVIINAATRGTLVYSALYLPSLHEWNWKRCWGLLPLSYAVKRLKLQAFLLQQLVAGEGVEPTFRDYDSPILPLN